MDTLTTREILEAYAHDHDPAYLAEDTVFIDMNSGAEHRGREAVAGMLHYVYHVAFDAHAEVRNLVVSPGKAVLEALFVGKHTGEFAGIPATGKDVRVPLCVTYDVAEDGIKEGRVYMAIGAMMKQLGANEAARTAA